MLCNGVLGIMLQILEVKGGFCIARFEFQQSIFALNVFINVETMLLKAGFFKFQFKFIFVF